MEEPQTENRRKTFAEKCNHHLELHEEDCDVVFLVGPKNEIVKASRLVLIVSSDGFKKMFEDRAQSCINNNSGENTDDPVQTPIVLPNVDPESFKIFLKLMLWNDTPVDKLAQLNLPLESLFCVIELCKEYEMIEVQKDLEALLRKFTKNFPRFIHSQEFLDLSENVLEKILLMDYLPLEEITIFAYVCKWAETQCQRRALEISGENMRKVLGKCLSLIRFPVISTQDFRTRVCPKNILSMEEELALFKYITLSQKEKKLASEGNGENKGVLGFSATRRSKFVGISFCIANHFRVVDDPPFLCNSLSELHSNYFRVNSRIAIVSLGFLGPVKTNSWYDVDVEIKSYPSSVSYGKLRKKVYGKNHTIFRVEFDSPVILEANQKKVGDTSETLKDGDGTYISSESWYEVEFNLSGANTQSIIFSHDTTGSLPLQTECSFKLDSKGVEFDCFWESCQLAEIRFERL